MQVTEAVNEGLKRELKVTFARDDMSTRMNERLEQLKGQVRINGFRPGKVPMNHLKKVYGKQVMAEIVNDIINNKTGEIIKERSERAAQQPEIAMTEDEKEAAAILAGEADFEYSITYEVIPPINVPELSSLKVERLLAEVDEKEIDEQIERIAESARSYEEKKGKAADKDRVTMNYIGKIDGEPFDGGADNDAVLIIGSGRFIPGFEEQLIGMKAGQEGTIEVTFPDDYSAPHLAGKKAHFDITVSKVEKPGKLEINDELATKLGIESVEKLREVIREQIERQYGSFTRAKIKRQLLDAIDEKTTMELPGKMVEQEFNNIWGQVTQELERANRSFEDEETTEEAARADYRKLAERRVRLGLVLAEIGEKAEITITEEEMQRALYAQMQQYPGQEQMILQYFRDHPDAVAGIRAPIFEDKVIDFILTKAEVTDKTVSKEELTKQDEE